MPKFRVWGRVVGTKYLGVFEVNSKEETEEKAIKRARVSICHHCSPECSDPELMNLNPKNPWGLS